MDLHMYIRKVEGTWYLFFENEFDFNRFKEMYPNLSKLLTPVKGEPAFALPQPSLTFDKWLRDFNHRNPLPDPWSPMQRVERKITGE